MRVHLPETFTNDAAEANPDLDHLWAAILDEPRVRRGGGWGRWVDLSPTEAAAIRREAAYRAEYWLTDAYGVDAVQPHERNAGRAAARVRDAIDALTNAG